MCVGGVVCGGAGREVATLPNYTSSSILYYTILYYTILFHSAENSPRSSDLHPANVCPSQKLPISPKTDKHRQKTFQNDTETSNNAKKGCRDYNRLTKRRAGHLPRALRPGRGIFVWYSPRPLAIFFENFRKFQFF